MNRNFEYDEKAGAYIGYINDIEFELEDDDEEKIEYAHQLADNYDSSVDKLVEYLLNDEDFADFYEEETKETVINKLNKPRIRLLSSEDGVIEFLNHKLDDYHIILVEFDGVFEAFTSVEIDG